MSQKTLYIIPRWGGNSHSDFYDWAKPILEKSGVKVVALDMPDPNTPTIEKWTNHLQQSKDQYFKYSCLLIRYVDIGEIDGSSYVMAHSVGNLALLNCLAGLTYRRLINVNELIF